MLAHRGSGAHALHGLSTRLARTFPARDKPSFAPVSLVGTIKLRFPSHLATDFHPSFALAPSFHTLRSPEYLAVDLDSPATFRSPIAFDSPTFDFDALDPHFPVLSDVGNLEPVVRLHHSCRLPELLILARNEHGHIPLALEWPDHNSQILAVTNPALCKADKSAAHLSVLVTILSRDNAAEYQ
jgi:hypothetical protein